MFYNTRRRRALPRTNLQVNSPPPAIQFTPPASPESRSAIQLMKKPSLRLDWTQMVTIKCVDEQDLEQTFVVHKCFLIHYSPVFNATLNGRFMESDTQSIDLFPISVEAFSIMVRWMYSQRLQDDEGHLPSAKELINVWILADNRKIPALQNQVLEALNESFFKAERLPEELFNHVYENTKELEKSTLRQMIVDLCVGQLGSLKFGDDIPREMLIDILKASGESKTLKLNKISKEKMKKYFVEEPASARHGDFVVPGS